MYDPLALHGPISSSGAGFSSDALVRQGPAHPGVPLAPLGIPGESDVRTHSPGAALSQGSDPAEPPGWEERLGRLPQGYGDDRLVCLPRDPTCAFVYWDLSAQTVAHAFEGLSPARALLKLILLSGALLAEVEIALEMNGFYLRNLPPGSDFRVELWAAGEKGARLLRSTRPVRLPPAVPSDELEEQYLHIALGLPLASAALAAGRPQTWRASSDFPGWSAETLASAAAATGARVGYPALHSGRSGGGRAASASSPSRGDKP